MPVRVLIVEDHGIMNRSLSEFLSAGGEIEISCTVSCAEEAIEALQRQAVDLALVDVSLPGMSGIDLVRRIQRESPAIRCLMLSGHSEASYVTRSLEAGARGYVLKGRPHEIPRAIAAVMAGETYLSETVRAKIAAAQANGA